MNNNILQRETIISFIFLILSYISLLIGFFNNENLSGGAIQDYNFYVGILNSFSENFIYSLLNYKEFNSDHSPFFISLLTLINIPFENLDLIKVKELDVLEIQTTGIYKAEPPVLTYAEKYNFLRFIFLHISLLTPLIFFKCLKIIYKDCNNLILFLLSLLIIFSPHYRSYAIWAGETNLGLLFLICSIYFYLKLIENKNSKSFLYIGLNVFFLALSAYARPIYCLLSIYFLYQYIQKFGIKKKLFQFILFNLFFAFPAFYYFFIMDNYPFVLYSNFFYNPSIVLYSTNIILSSSIIFFYSIPFLLINFTSNKFNLISLNKNNIIIFGSSLLLTLFMINNFDYNQIMNGGGIIYKFSNKLLGNNNFLFFVSIFAIYVLLKIILKKNLNDFILLTIIFCFDPDPWIYHKSFDPIFYCLVLTVFDNKLFKGLNSSNQKTFGYCVLFYYLLVFLVYIFIRH